MCTKAPEMYGSAILNRRGGVGYRGFRARENESESAAAPPTGDIGQHLAGLRQLRRTAANLLPNSNGYARA
jgi:hypothetical protein